MLTFILAKSEQIESLFITLKNYKLQKLETCVNICIKKQRQYLHAVNQVYKGILIFGTIHHRNTF